MPEEREELKFRIALTLVPAVGPVTARKLIEKAGSAVAVFSQKKEFLQKIEGIGPRMSETLRFATVMEEAEQELLFLEKHNISALYYRDPRYPWRLNHCNDGPILLYSKGTNHLNPDRCLSVVGTRQASSYGKDLCRELVRELAYALPGLVIVSGLAYGIDVIAHRAALEFGLPTVAVLGHGLATLYPASHRETAKRILKQGTLVTDFDSRMGPERNNFLRRNRIIAGLSDATLVVESPVKGGALITAGMAASYNRDVLAVPGRAGDHRSEGCNNLIKRNLAGLVESAADIMKHLNWHAATRAQTPQPASPGPTPDEKRVLDQIRNTPGVGPGSLSQLTGLPLPSVLALLIEMELKKLISVEPGNRYRARIDPFP